MQMQKSRMNFTISSKQPWRASTPTTCCSFLAIWMPRWEVTTPGGNMSWASMELGPSTTTESDWQTFVKRITCWLEAPFSSINTFIKQHWRRQTGPQKKKKKKDHVIINRRRRSSLQDVRAYRGADVASDHTLVLAVVSLKLRRSKGRQARQQRLDSGRLNESLTKQAFEVEVKNRFQVLGEQQEMTIDGFNQALREAGEKVLGFRRKKKEEWIKEETWKKIDERKQTKEKINNTRSERLKEKHRSFYSELNKQVKRMTGADKKDYIEKLADEAEEAAGRNDLKTLAV